MADFSKQYCEIYDPEFPFDFDIEEMAESIPNNHYIPIICEGFGFLAIERGNDGKIYLIFDAGEDGVDKVEYETFIKNHKLKSQGI